MRRNRTLGICGALILAAVVGLPATVQAQTQRYELVPSWPQIPAGMFFGTRADQTGLPCTGGGSRQFCLTPAQKEANDRATAAAAASRAQAQAAQGGQAQAPRPAPRAQDNVFGTGVSGIAIDSQDNVYIFNRGTQTVLVFDRDGKFVRGGAEKDAQGNQIAGGWLHSGEVDWEGNVWVVERDNHRLLKYDPTLKKVLMQIGTPGVAGNDATHFDLPSGISVLHNGNLVVTDGYGNNRVVLLDKNGKFIKQVGKGAGGREDKGAGPGEWNLPHQAAVTAGDSIFIVDRENKRVQVFDKDLNFVRQFANPGWNPWDIAIGRRGTDRIAAIADHATEEIHVISLDDGKILWTTGKPGQGPGEFDWVHGMAIDSRGAIYAADTYGQRVQKFAPVSPTAGR